MFGSLEVQKFGRSGVWESVWLGGWGLIVWKFGRLNVRSLEVRNLRRFGILDVCEFGSSEVRKSACSLEAWKCESRLGFGNFGG